MARRIIFVLIILALGLAAWRFSPFGHKQGDPNLLTAYGNVDLRQVDLAFKDQERIAAVLVEEGVRVAAGQPVATLETARLESQIGAAEARVAAQDATFARLKNGSRVQEIAQAKANVRAAETQLANAERTFGRRTPLKTSGAASEEDVVNARAARDVATDQLRVAREQLSLLVEGSRKEDIEQARATLVSLKADLATLKQQLADSRLLAPSAGVVRNRLLEPGDMASPQRPVLTIALTEPKWVRCYLRGPDLGRVKPGMKAKVFGDAFPGKAYEGWVGFISPMAEFTPKSVETPELRTNLVYETRVYVADPDDELRLGMPATVRIALSGAADSSEKK